MQTLSQCPLCNFSSFSQFITCVDFTVSKSPFNIVKCNHCSFLFTNPRPDENEIGSYYESDDYVSHSNTSKGLINKVYQVVRNYSIKQKVKMLNGFGVKQKTIIDIGCGTGEFLNAMQQNGWQVQGLEPSDRARNLGIDNYKLKVQPLDAFYQLPKKSFGIITLWHVLEHVDQLHAYMNQLQTILDDAGVLVIAVPNAGAYEATVYKEYWAAYDVPRHLNHFTIATMTQLVTAHKFRIENIIPMPFDAFYISMLSEKYKQSGAVSTLTNAILNGINSNQKAASDKQLASSLIYIIRHEN